MRDRWHTDLQKKTVSTNCHSLNLQALMEFSLPVVQDYAVALKGNYYASLEKCLYALVAFCVIWNAQESLDYWRSLYCFVIMTRYLTITNCQSWRCFRPITIFLRRIWWNCLNCSSHIAAHNQSCQVWASSFAFRSSVDWEIIHSEEEASHAK